MTGSHIITSPEELLCGLETLQNDGLCDNSFLFPSRVTLEFPRLTQQRRRAARGLSASAQRSL